VETQDVADTFVTAALNASVSPAKTLWTFSSWEGNYSRLVYSTCGEELSDRAQKIIVKSGAANSAGNRVVRLFYGDGYSQAGKFNIPHRPGGYLKHPKHIDTDP
jgi:hypothetical protein